MDSSEGSMLWINVLPIVWFISCLKNCGKFIVILISLPFSGATAQSSPEPPIFLLYF
jgi:hypothetical protein